MPSAKNLIIQPRHMEQHEFKKFVKNLPKLNLPTIQKTNIKSMQYIERPKVSYIIP